MKRLISLKRVRVVLLAMLLSLVFFMPVKAASLSQDADSAEIEDIFTFDWKDASVEEINDTVYASSDEEIGVWLSSMSEEERESLLELNTCLHNRTELEEYTVDQDGNLECTGETVSMEFYEYALSSVPKNNYALTFNSKSGYYNYKFWINGVGYNYRMGVSGLDKEKNANSVQQKVTLALTVPSDAPGWLEFTSAAGITTVQKKLQADNNGKYTVLICPFTFTKPAGYVCDLTYSPIKDETGIYDTVSSGSLLTYVPFSDMAGYKDSTIRMRETIEAHIHVRDFGIGTTNSSGDVADSKKITFHFTLTPITYFINYNSNGGSGSMAKQTCKYGTVYTPSANGFKNEYAVAYNGNGGNPSRARDTVAFEFAGWGLDNNSSVSHTLSTSFSNLATVHGGSRTFYAIWNKKSINLPTATREGYTFEKWEDERTKYTYGEGDPFIPTVSTSLKAYWSANTYTIKFNTNGGTTVDDIKAVYDEEVTLPVPEREGYEFLGWSGAGGTYTGTTKNLCSTNNGTVVMSALWEGRKDIPYTVIHKLQIDETGDENKDYVEYEVEHLVGTLGESVTAAVKEYKGYVAPPLQVKIIEADGSTKFIYKYKLDRGNMTTYRVEHYLQSKEDEAVFILDEENVFEDVAEEGVSITPDVITTYTGYVVPEPQTVIVAPNGTTVVKYYYMLTEDEKNKYEEGTGDINNFKPGDIKYYTDSAGNEYEIIVNHDGTLIINGLKKLADSKKVLTIYGTVNINGVNYQVTEIAPYAFKNNKNLKKVKIGTGIKKIGTGAFFGCTSLETVKTNKELLEIGSKAFYNCKKLKNYVVGKYVKKIGSKAFYNCKKLQKIVIAESMEIVENKAFYGCSKLKKVNIKTNKLIKVGKAAFKKCNKELTFTIPSKKKKAYIKLLRNKY